MMNTQHSISERLAQSLTRIPDEKNRKRARFHLLDWLGCVAGARQSAAGLAIRQAEKDPIKCAAFLGNVLEMDDIHRTAILHPGPCIWPVVLNGDADFDARLDAAIRGYEATIAIGATFDAKHYGSYHNTSTAGIFGAAAAKASLLHVDEEAMADALGLAGSVAGGLWQMRHEQTLAKQWHTLHAAEAGCKAAEYAAAGITGPREILEGPQGLYAATCDTPKHFESGFGWRIDEVSFKPWGACRHAHPAIDVALEMKADGNLDGDIHIETYGDAIIFCDRPDPQSVIDAKFSIQHAVAIVGTRGIPQLADFEPDAIADLDSARKRVTVSEADDITQRYPNHYGARISANGKTLELIDTRGDPDRPMDDDSCIAKARELMNWGGVSDDAEVVIDAALNGTDHAVITSILQKWLS